MLTPEQLAEIERWFGMYRDDTYQHGQALLAEVKRLQAERGAARTLARCYEDLLWRALSIREHGENPRDGRYQWPTWDRDADKALRAGTEVSR